MTHRSVFHCSLPSRWVCTWWKAPAPFDEPFELALPYLSVAEVPVGHSSCQSPQLRAGIWITYDKSDCFAMESSSHQLPGGSSGFYLRFSQETFEFFPMGGVLKAQRPFPSDLGSSTPLRGSLCFWKTSHKVLGSQLLRHELPVLMELWVGGPLSQLSPRLHW